MCRELLEHLGGHAADQCVGRDVVDDHGPGRYDGPSVNSDAGKDHRAGPDPTPVLDRHGRRNKVTGAPLSGAEHVAVGEHEDLVAYGNVVADCDLIADVEVATAVDPTPLPDREAVLAATATADDFDVSTDHRAVADGDPGDAQDPRSQSDADEVGNQPAQCQRQIEERLKSSQFVSRGIQHTRWRSQSPPPGRPSSARGRGRGVDHADTAINSSTSRLAFASAS
jgi:hypothetical protein